jgi:hypothetical protein
MHHFWPLAKCVENGLKVGCKFETPSQPTIAHTNKPHRGEKNRYVVCPVSGSAHALLFAHAPGGLEAAAAASTSRTISGGGRASPSRPVPSQSHEARGASEEATSRRRCRWVPRRRRRRRGRGRTPRLERPPGSPPSRPSTRSTSSAPASKVTPPLRP